MRPSKLIFLTTSWQLFLNSDCESFNGRVISCRRRVIRRSKNSLGNDGGPTYGPGTLIDYDAFPAEPGDDSDQTSFDGEDLDQLWDIDAHIGMQETVRTWVVKEAVQKACGLGMHVPLQSFSVLNCEEVVLSHDGHGYRLQANHWRELLDGRPYAFGFARLLEVV